VVKKKLRIPRRELKAAVQLYESFREKTPRRLDVIEFEVPKVVAVIGHLEALDYRTTHADDTKLYNHKFVPGSRPLLCVSADGRCLLLLGGRYRFTERGIVDRDARGKEVENKKHGKKVD
jgi:hypothetical protein